MVLTPAGRWRCLRYLGERLGVDVSQDELHREVWGYARIVEATEVGRRIVVLGHSG